MKIIGLALALFGSFALSSMAHAQSSIVIEQPWARATPMKAKTGAVFFRLRNTGSSEEVLTGVITEAAERAELHESVNDNGIMRMRALRSVSVPAGGIVEFEPGGKHVMLSKLKSPLAAGQSFKMTLTFKSAAPQTVTVEVKAISAMPEAKSTMPAMEMHH